MLNVMCPECDQEFSLPENPAHGDEVECPDCDAELEIVSLEPPKVRLRDEEDEEDDDDEDDDEF